MIRMQGLKPYIMEDADQPEPARGDIAIQIVGLNKGEKLYEELLIGNDPRGTDHPRIMRATEVALTRDELKPLLDRLQRACAAFDIVTIRQTLLNVALAYQPTGSEIHDLTWNAARRNVASRKPARRYLEPAQ
jgi:FlaA1/EpsC-like NDP-sugar epimerase